MNKLTVSDIVEMEQKTLRKMMLNEMVALSESLNSPDSQYKRNSFKTIFENLELFISHYRQYHLE